MSLGNSRNPISLFLWTVDVITLTSQAIMLSVMPPCSLILCIGSTEGREKPSHR